MGSMAVGHSARTLLLFSLRRPLGKTHEASESFSPSGMPMSRDARPLSRADGRFAVSGPAALWLVTMRPNYNLSWFTRK